MFTLSNISRASIFTALCLAFPAIGNAADTYAPRVEFGARLEPGNRIVHGAGQDAKGFSDYSKNFNGDHQPLIYMTYTRLYKPVAEITDWGSRLRSELAALSPAKRLVGRRGRSGVRSGHRHGDNPLMGFRPDLGRRAFEHEYATLARHYIKWNEIENAEDDGIDRIRAFCNEKWKGVEAARHQGHPRLPSLVEGHPEVLAR